MSRKQQLRELQLAEAILETRHKRLQQVASSRLDHLRQLHPAWVVTAGFFAGVVTHRAGRWALRAGLASSLLGPGFRLLRAATGHWFADIGGSPR